MGIVVTSGQAAALVAAGVENNPMVVSDNLAAAGTLTSIRGELADGALANAVDGRTSDFWLPDMAGLTTADIDVALSAPAEMDFVGLVGHNFGTLGIGVRAQYSTNGGTNWTSMTGSDVVPADDEAFGIWFEPQSRDRVRLLLSNVPVSSQPFAAVVHFGRSLSVPQRLYKDYRPRIVPTEVEQNSNVTEGGHLVGTKTIRQGSTIEAPIAHLSSDFVRGASWLGFMKHFNRTRPFFFGFRPTDYPLDFHYAWRTGATIRPLPMGVQDYHSLTLSMRIYDA